MTRSIIAAFLFLPTLVFAQTNGATDTSDVEAVRRMVSLSEVVVRSDLNVARFLQRIKDDTTYYKAFKNLHVLSYTALNSIQLRNKKGNIEASLDSKTRQHRAAGCRTTEVLQEKTTGDFYDRRRDYNYYTAELYAAFFFTRDRVCGENNIVRGSEHNVHGKRGLEKHKEMLKMMFFNPGKKIPGIPFIGDKLDVFDPDITRFYNYSIDVQPLNGEPCYVFTIQRKEDLSGFERGRVVFDNITTWFDQKTMEIMGRNYDMSYDAGVYDFDVHMQVEMIKIGEYLVPRTLRYSGNWFLLSKKRERGVFTATLFDFKRG